MLDTDLQLSTDEELVESVDHDQVIEESDVAEESKVDEQVDDEEIDESFSKDEQIEEQPKKNDTVSLARFMQEKKRRKDLEKILAQQASEREKYNVTQGYLERGYPESEATLLAQRDVQHKTELETLTKRFQETEIKDLARTSDFYSDAETFADEIKEKMKSMSIGAKDAYMLLRGEARTHEIRQKQEQLNAVKRKQVIAKKVTTASPSAPSAPYKLDDADKKALSMLKKMQPDAGWSEEKYHKSMKT